MKVAIVGFDTEGRASYDYFRQLSAGITICDQNESIALPDGAAGRLGPAYLEGLDDFDVIVRTPGLNPKNVLASNPGVAAKITSGTNIFFETVTTANIIGVTGTKGKGTTSTLITKMLEAAGKRVWLGGNIGVPALSFMPQVQPDDWVVLELSSFQLSDLRYSPRIGVCLMMAPEHLNWHDDMPDYIDAKKHLFAAQTADDVAIYLAGNEDSKTIAGAGHGRLLPYFDEPGAEVIDDIITIDGTPICSVHELRLLGRHNWQNACAAVTAVWQVTRDVDAMKQVLTTFSGLEHRLEYVAEIDGVSYYDDSFGTTPETAMVAIEAFAQPKVLILGGSDKGVSFETLTDTVISSDVKAVITIGQTGPAIAELLRAKGYDAIHDGGESMDTIVAAAAAQASQGSVVLLSTGCASFGMFDNYKQRGELFKTVVRARAANAG